MRYLILSLMLTLVVSCKNSNPKVKENGDSHSCLQIAIADDPFSLDPRVVRDLAGSSLMRMLFEGLMRTNLQGEIVPGTAKSYELSDDQKTYTFYLHSTTWSDGSPLTAEDFEQTWKSILSPAFPAPNAYQLYQIKGAKAAKQGIIPLDAVGIKALNPFTLVIELERPEPSFLEMVTCHFFFPVHHSMRTKSEKQQNNHIGNGPFKLQKWTRRSEVNLAKNDAYWDAKHVALNGICLQILDEHTALQLFKAAQLDWAGSPLSTLPQDAIATLKQHNQLRVAAGAGTHWLRLNTSKAPFNDKKMRVAFALAIDRQAIVEHITQGNQQVATAIIPPSFGLSQQDDYSGHDFKRAQLLFNEALADIKLLKSQLPPITLSYASNDRNHKIAQAIQQQWMKTFDIPILLNGNESQLQLDKVKTGHYQMSMGSWYADIQDPMNFLEIFKSKNNPTNQTFWDHEHYRTLLDQATLELSQQKRKHILAEAEKILIQEMPIIPLFHSAYNYLKSNRVENVFFSPLGYIDFKEAHLIDEKKSSR